MEKIKLFTIVIVVALIIGAGFTYFFVVGSKPDPSDDVTLNTEPEADGHNLINWYQYDEGIERAEIEGKKIFINFHADWCYYCKLMIKTTFKDAFVISYLNDNFIAIRVDTVREKKLALDYKINGLPANWFLEANGEKIALKQGYLTSEILLQSLKFIYEEKYKNH